MIVKIVQNIKVGVDSHKDWLGARKAFIGLEKSGPLYFQAYASGTWKTDLGTNELEAPLLLDNVAPRFVRFKRTNLFPTDGSVLQLVCFFEAVEADEAEVSAAHELHEQRAEATKARKEAARKRMASMDEKGIKPGRKANK